MIKEKKILSENAKLRDDYYKKEGYKNNQIYQDNRDYSKKRMAEELQKSQNLNINSNTYVAPNPIPEIAKPNEIAKPDVNNANTQLNTNMNPPIFIYNAQGIRTHKILRQPDGSFKVLPTNDKGLPLVTIDNPKVLTYANEAELNKVLEIKKGQDGSYAKTENEIPVFTPSKEEIQMPVYQKKIQPVVETPQIVPTAPVPPQIDHTKKYFPTDDKTYQPEQNSQTAPPVNAPAPNNNQPNYSDEEVVLPFIPDSNAADEEVTLPFSPNINAPQVIVKDGKVIGEWHTLPNGDVEYYKEFNAFGNPTDNAEVITRDELKKRITTSGGKPSINPDDQAITATNNNSGKPLIINKASWAEPSPTNNLPQQLAGVNNNRNQILEINPDTQSSHSQFANPTLANNFGYTVKRQPAPVVEEVKRNADPAEVEIDEKVVEEVEEDDDDADNDDTDVTPNTNSGIAYPMMPTNGKWANVKGTTMLQRRTPGIGRTHFNDEADHVLSNPISNILRSGKESRANKVGNDGLERQESRSRFSDTDRGGFNDSPHEKKMSSKQLEKQAQQNYIRELAQAKIANPEVTQLPNLPDAKTARKYEREVDKLIRESNRNNGNASSANNNRVAKINQRVDDRFWKPSGQVEQNVQNTLNDARNFNNVETVKNNQAVQASEAAVDAKINEVLSSSPLQLPSQVQSKALEKGKKQYGGYVPKAQAGGMKIKLNTDNSFKASDFTKPALKLDAPNNDVEYRFNNDFDKNFKSKYIQDVDPLIPITEKKPFNVDTSQRFDWTKKAPVQQQFNSYDPTRLRVYGNKMQHAANLVPVGFNSANAIFNKAEVQNPIFNTHDTAYLQGLARNKVNANMQGITDTRAALNQAVRSNARGSGQLINSLQAAHNASQKQMQDETHKVAIANQAQQNAFLEAYHKVGDTRREIRTLNDEKNRQHRLTQDKFGKNTIESIEKAGLEKGKLHNAELKEHMQVENYLNQISGDYEYVMGANGVYYVKGKEGSSKSGFLQPLADFQRDIENLKKSKAEAEADASKNLTFQEKQKAEIEAAEKNAAAERTSLDAAKKAKTDEATGNKKQGGYITKRRIL